MLVTVVLELEPTAATPVPEAVEDAAAAATADELAAGAPPAPAAGVVVAGAA